MKKTLLSLVIVLGTLLSTQAQNWACFYPNDTSYFLDGDNQMYGLAVNDSANNNGIMKYTVFRTVEFDTSCFVASAAYNVNVFTWPGPEIHKLANGDYRFFNKNWDTILIKSLARINDIWVFYSDNNSGEILAEVTSIDTATILGYLDSVKTITLRSNSNNQVVSQWNGQQLRISKLHGIVDMPKILAFPSQTDLLIPSLLKPLTYGEVYNYNIGDYFQIESRVNNPVEESIEYIYTEVLDKSISNQGESVTYTILEERVIVSSFINPAVYSTVKTRTYNNLSAFVGSAIPNKVEIDSSQFLYTEMAISNNNGYGFGKRITKNNQFYLVEQRNDTCYDWVGAYIDGDGSPTYYECLGALHNSLVINGMLTQKVIYYNLCGQQGGTKITVSIPKLPETHVKIYPNPASNLLQIENTGSKGYAITIATLQGQVVNSLTAKAAQNTTVDVSNLALGVYIIRLDDGANAYFKKVVIAR